MNPATSPVAHSRPLFLPAQFLYESQLMRALSLFKTMATLQSERLTLRPFREGDVDLMDELFANPDFMRFSLGVFTKREQTVAFIEKVIGWDRAGMPSQFAVVPRGEKNLVGYCGFFHHPEHGIDETEIGYRLHPTYWNVALPPKRPARCAITAFEI